MQNSHRISAHLATGVWKKTIDKNENNFELVKAMKILGGSMCDNFRILLRRGVVAGNYY